MNRELTKLQQILEPYGLDAAPNAVSRAVRWSRTAAGAFSPPMNWPGTRRWTCTI